MPLFPAFLDLSGSTVLIMGEGAEADRKAEKLRPFCTRVLRSSYPPEYDERPALVLLTEEAECTFHEFDERSCYFVDIPGGHHVYRVSVDADTGAVIEAAMCK